MNRIPRTAPSANQPMSRDLLLTLIEAALHTDELRYARRLSTAWLAAYPGDLQANLLFARAYAQEKTAELRSHALPILEQLCQLDPEFIEAQEMLAEMQRTAGNAKYMTAKACVEVLRAERDEAGREKAFATPWAKYLHDARNALDTVRSGDYQHIEKAEHFIHKALLENPDTPLAAVMHLRLMESKGSMPKSAVRSLAQIYHERWPDCLQFSLTYANELMESGESNQAVTLLHQAVTRDIGGQVPKRMWGSHHQYETLWPAQLEASYTSANSPQNIPIPAAVASYLGWNQIGAGPAASAPAATPANGTHRTAGDAYRSQVGTLNYTYTPHDFSAPSGSMGLSDSSQKVQSELERLADELKRPHVVREDGRFPIYVIFSTRAGLEGQYGPSGYLQIDAELKKLATAVQGHKVNQEYWGSRLIYADDIASTRAFDLQPAPYNDPWKLKVCLNGVDVALEKRGERIGALLIVGGPEVVPFHHLPNPVEDADNDVPSDNPYATRDNNYFICDWPVGRISAGMDTDPRHLVAMIKEITSRYKPVSLRFSWYQRLFGFVQELIRKGISKNQSSFGYTASIWKLASQAVYRTIGAPNEMLVSPPIHACNGTQTATTHAEPQISQRPNTCLLLPQSRLGYFNLHGIPDGAEWYGQVDPAQPEEGPDFPVAIRPQDIRNSGSAPRLVFTEACYGSNITGKNIDDAISLKFIASGTQAVIGSTCISYGSITTPLTAADLLGRVFWTLLQEGFTAGESLKRAKIHLTREMHRRQGFLDAEDQKTLISFLLFGDPLSQPFQAKTNPKTQPHLSDSAVPVPTVCEQSFDNEAEKTVSLETIAHLKSVVEQYLPSMADARVSLSRERQSCANFCNHYWTGKQCIHANEKNKPEIKYHRRVVTMSKNYEKGAHTHRQYARLTLDDDGKIVKMVVSH